MFYSNNPSSMLRCGDIVVGFRTVTPTVDAWSPDNHCAQWGLAISLAKYYAVITPCCSIEGKTIALAPLDQVRPAFRKNPHLAEDLTRINRPVAPELSCPPAAWEGFTEERRAELLAKGPGYIFLDCFVYPPHGLLEEYEWSAKEFRGVKEGHYLLDFKSIFNVKCKLIERGIPSPAGTKLLELSVEARGCLREKLVQYFGRVPAEDAA